MSGSCPNCRGGNLLPCPVCATYGAHDGFCEHGLAPDLWDDFLEMVDRGLLPAIPCDQTFSEFGTGTRMACSLPPSHTHGPECDCDSEPHQSIEHLIGSYRAERESRMIAAGRFGVRSFRDQEGMTR